MSTTTLTDTSRRELARRVNGGLEITLFWADATTAPASSSTTRQPTKPSASACRPAARLTRSTTRSPT
jgi:hypothetical protein